MFVSLFSLMAELCEHNGEKNEKVLKVRRPPPTKNTVHPWPPHVEPSGQLQPSGAAQGKGLGGVGTGSGRTGGAQRLRNEGAGGFWGSAGRSVAAQ